jgi:hypothetical protein
MSNNSQVQGHHFDSKTITQTPVPVPEDMNLGHIYIIHCQVRKRGQVCNMRKPKYLIMTLINAMMNINYIIIVNLKFCFLTK